MLFETIVRDESGEIAPFFAPCFFLEELQEGYIIKIDGLTGMHRICVESTNENQAKSNSQPSVRPLVCPSRAILDPAEAIELLSTWAGLDNLARGNLLNVARSWAGRQLNRLGVLRTLWAVMYDKSVVRAAKLVSVAMVDRLKREMFNC